MEIKKLKDIPFSGYPIGLEFKDGSTYHFNLDYIKWDDYVNVKTGEYVKVYDVTDDLSEDFKSLNDLLAMGEVKEHDYLNRVEWEDNSKLGCHIESISYSKIIDFFKEHGYNVTKEALEHNYHYSVLGYKCGYRDEENNYFLFTPCGDINPLSFTASRLHEGCEWQSKTYEW